MARTPRFGSHRRRDEPSVVADAVLSELRRDAEVVAKRLGLMGQTEDTTRVSDAEWIGIVREHWDDPDFRRQTLEEYVGPIAGPHGLVPKHGLDRFLKLVQQAFPDGYTPPPPPPGPPPAGADPSLAPLVGQPVPPPDAGGAPPMEAPPGGVPLPPEGPAGAPGVMDPFAPVAPSSLPPPPPDAFAMSPGGTIGPGGPPPVPPPMPG